MTTSTMTTSTMTASTMATKTEIRDMIPADRVVIWALMAGLAVILLHYAEAAALPAHFV